MRPRALPRRSRDHWGDCWRPAANAPMAPRADLLAHATSKPTRAGHPPSELARGGHERADASAEGSPADEAPCRMRRAANAVNGAYQIIGIAPGTYKGNANLRGVSVDSAKPMLLFIGLEGAAKTIIDGELKANFGWVLQQTAVVASLTLQQSSMAFYVDAPGKEVRFVDVLVRDNHASTGLDAAAIRVNAAARVRIVGSTFVENTGSGGRANLMCNATGAQVTVSNSVLWTTTEQTMLSLANGCALSASNSLAKGVTLAGAGNLPGDTDPKLFADGHLRRDSALRGAGASVAQSRIDMDGELRPSSGRDIGVDHFVDIDADGLPDRWELAIAGNLTSINGAADDDGDGLSNEDEYDWESDHTNPDTDRDGLPDGYEVANGFDPVTADSDEIDVDLNGDGLIESVGLQLGYGVVVLDADGDGVANDDEVAMCLDPHRADSDGDGVSDSVDAFPHDRLMSALVADPSDMTPPVITLTAPWYAVEL